MFPKVEQIYSSIPDRKIINHSSPIITKEETPHQTSYAELVVSPKDHLRIIGSEYGDFANHNGSMVFEVQSKTLFWWLNFLNLHFVDTPKTKDFGVTLNILDKKVNQKTGLLHGQTFAYWDSAQGEQVVSGKFYTSSDNYFSLVQNQFPFQPITLPERINLSSTVWRMLETISQAIQKPSVLNQAVFDPQTLTFAPPLDKLIIR